MVTHTYETERERERERERRERGGKEEREGGRDKGRESWHKYTKFTTTQLGTYISTN